MKQKTPTPPPTPSKKQAEDAARKEAFAKYEMKNSEKTK